MMPFWTRKDPTGDMHLLTIHYYRSPNSMMSLDGLFEDQPQPPADPTHSSSAMHLLLTQDIPMTEGDIQPHQSPPANKFMHVAECLDNRPSKDMLASSMVEDFAMQMEAQSLPAPASLQFIVESSGML